MNLNKQSLASFTGKKVAAFIVTLVVLGASFAPAALAEDKDSTSGARPGLAKIFNIAAKAAVGSGVAASKADNSFVVTKDGKNITVNVTDKTQFRRRFWGKSSLNEIQTGDTVNVIGLWSDDSHTTINARLVRDLSIQKRAGVFFGTVKSKTSDTVWVISTVNRGDQTVTVDTTTKLVNRKEETISQSDIKVGDRIRVKGLWDKSASTITQVTHVKDFDLPEKVNPTATP
ncbi:MAG TPA: DUF5666 domain-containing protein [Patescibacteria group bacterium]